MGWRYSSYSQAEKVVFVCALLALAWLVLYPIGALIYGSLQTDSLVSPNRQWTLEKIKAIYWTTEYIKPTLNTFYIAGPATILAVVIGVALAWLFTRTNMLHKGPLSILVVSPLLLSPFVGAVAWISLLGPETGFVNVFFDRLPAHRYLIFFPCRELL